MDKALILQESIETKILLIRSKRVMIDHDLAGLYNVSTKVLNQAVKRNIRRFPKETFIFQLNQQEKTEVVTTCDHLKMLKFSPKLPYAFTEHGVAMLSSVLNSEQAIQVNIQIILTFNKLREIIVSHKGLQHKIDEMEKKYDQQFQSVFNAIRRLLTPKKEKPKKQIGFLR
ncbi:MAG: ORF6N domain-containing protein [Elusimicrobiota bacterium]